MDVTSHGNAPQQDGHLPATTGTADRVPLPRTAQGGGNVGDSAQGGARVTSPAMPSATHAAAQQSAPTLTQAALQTLGGHTTRDQQEADAGSLGMSSNARRQQRNKYLQETELPPRVHSKYHSKGVRNGLEIVRIVEHDLPPIPWISGVPAPYGKDVHMSDGTIIYTTHGNCCHGVHQQNEAMWRICEDRDVPLPK